MYVSMMNDRRTVVHRTTKGSSPNTELYRPGNQSEAVMEETQQTYSILFCPNDIQCWDGWQGDGDQDIHDQGTKKEQDSWDTECSGHGKQAECRTMNEK